MKKRGCLLTFAVVCLLLTGAVAYFYLNYQNLYNPIYNGKRVYAWSEQAIHDHDPAARAEATQALVSAFKEMRPGEPRIQLVMYCCSDGLLPKEIIPFLIEALHAHEIQAPGSYQAIALSRVEGTAAVPALVEVALNDEDPHARAGAVAALRMMGPKAKAAEPDLRRAASEGEGEARHRAEEALQEIERATGKTEKERGISSARSDWHPAARSDRVRARRYAMPRTLFAVPLLVLVVPAPAVLSGPPAAPGADFGKTKVEIPVPSRWIIVKGSKGKDVVAEGSVTFKKSNQIVIDVKIAIDDALRKRTYQYEYQLSPMNGLPIIGGLIPSPRQEFGEERGTFRLVGNRLEFKLVGDDELGKPGRPRGDLLLLLRPEGK